MGDFAPGTESHSQPERRAERAAPAIIEPVPPYKKHGPPVLRTLWFMALAVVIVASLLPSDSSMMKTLDRFPIGDKAEHLLAYAVLGFLPAIHERRGILAALALGVIALGVAMEYGQLLCGWRTFEVADMLADAIGVGMGLVAALPLRIAVASDRL
jgi:VanZ family protein